MMRNPARHWSGPAQSFEVGIGYGGGGGGGGGGGL